MKKIFKNKKGFTLVELLAVIVILAIIMVIATQQIGKVIAGARSDSFVESYQIIERQVRNFILSEQSDQVTCNNVEIDDSIVDCHKKYGVSNDYTLSVSAYPPTGTQTGYKITLEATTDGKFDNMDLTKYGKVKCDSSANKIKINNSDQECTDKSITGTISLD